MNRTNQSPEMKTAIETFFIEETLSLVYDDDQLQKWNKYVDELGLTGQSAIVKTDKSPIPFMFMNTSFVRMCETLCPRKVDIKSYNCTPIPVEILDLVALSVREKYFTEIQIWYNETDKDPFCIGITKKYGYLVKKYDTIQEAREKENNPSLSEYSYELKYYLLGRWADVKASFSQLMERAKKRWINERGNSARIAIRDAQKQLEGLEIDANAHFGFSDESLDALPF